MFDPGVTHKTVKVVVQVPGSKDIERTIDVASEGESSLSLDLKEVRSAGDAAASGDEGSRATGGASGAGGRSTGGTPRNSLPAKSKSKGSGLIDI